MPALTTPFSSTSAEERKPNAPSFSSVSGNSSFDHHVTYSILNRNSDKVVIVRVDDLTHVLLPVASSIPTAVNPDEYWKFPSSLEVGGIHVEEQAIFTA